MCSKNGYNYGQHLAVLRRKIEFRKLAMDWILFFLCWHNWEHGDIILLCLSSWVFFYLTRKKLEKERNKKERNCLIWDRTHGLPFQAHTL